MIIAYSQAAFSQNAVAIMPPARGGLCATNLRFDELYIFIGDARPMHTAFRPLIAVAAAMRVYLRGAVFIIFLRHGRRWASSRPGVLNR